MGRRSSAVSLSVCLIHNNRVTFSLQGLAHQGPWDDYRMPITKSDPFDLWLPPSPSSRDAWKNRADGLTGCWADGETHARWHDELMMIQWNHAIRVDTQHCPIRAQRMTDNPQKGNNKGVTSFKLLSGSLSGERRSMSQDRHEDREAFFLQNARASQFIIITGRRSWRNCRG